MFFKKRYNPLAKPKRCPFCGSKNLAKILYGLPVESSKLDRQIARGKIILGGCNLTENSPLWTCNKCNENIYLSHQNITL